VRTDIFWLSEEQFVQLQEYLPPHSRSRGVKRVDDRRVLSGIIYCIKRGMVWTDVPQEYGPAKTLYNRFKRWSGKGIFQHIFKKMVEQSAVPATLLIDATHIKTHRVAANGVKKSSAKTPMKTAASGARAAG
jgi:transposase